MIEISNLDYDEYIDLIGTAHFTRRSINDAYEAIRSLRPMDVALELDWGRYRQLNIACVGCSRRESCRGLCEFTGAADALGNVDANIWLIDMTEQEIRQRIRRMTPYERPQVGLTVNYRPAGNPFQLWEMGFKERVIDYTERQMEALRKISPSIPRVLIDERNALMAARLAWIASKNLDAGKKPRILAFVGAVHVKGIKELLSNPILIKEKLENFNLPFTKPAQIRRVAVQGN